MGTCIGETRKIDQIFSRLRNNGHYWLRVGKYKIKHVRDLTNEGYDSEQSDGKPKLPVSKSNMLTYTFENGCVATFRLSGTEPKFKYYFELSDSSLEKAEKLVSGDGQVRDRRNVGTSEKRIEQILMTRLNFHVP